MADIWKTVITKQEFLKMISAIEFPLEFLTHANGIEALASRVLASTDESKAIMDQCAKEFDEFVSESSKTLNLALELLRMYEQLPKNILPRPKLLTEASITSAMIKRSAVINKEMKIGTELTGTCPVSSGHLIRFTDFLMNVIKLDLKSIHDIFWLTQIKDDLFTTPFITFVSKLADLRRFQALVPGDNISLEKKIPAFCNEIMLKLGNTPPSNHRCTLESLSSPNALKSMDTAGLQLLEDSKNDSFDEDFKVDCCIAGTALLTFKVYIIAKQYSSKTSTVLPAPTKLLESLTSLSQAWVTSAYCFASTNYNKDDFRNVLGYMIHNAMIETGGNAIPAYMGQIVNGGQREDLTERTLTATYTAQEAISTIMATSGWIFATHLQDEDYFKSKRVIFDAMLGASLVNNRLGDLHTMNINGIAEDNLFPKTVALCEAGLKAVEAASKALLWGWKLAPMQILESYSRCPEKFKFIPDLTVEHLTHPEVSFAPHMHRVLFETLRAVLMTYPGGDSSPELAKKAGATILKAFFAMESEPHPDWVRLMGMNVPTLKANAYFNMPVMIMLDPDLTGLSERPNPRLFTTAIAPILANPEPWLENAIKIEYNDYKDDGREPFSPMLYTLQDLARQQLHAAMKDVVPGSELQEKRAIARARAMATLQCGYVGCKIIMLPEQKTKVCSACKMVKYCSEKCLKGDWKKNHKIARKAIAAGK